MPRCFMAKKLKYPYEQWKQEQQNRKSTSRSPSPAIVPDRSDDEEEEPEWVIHWLHHPHGEESFEYGYYLEVVSEGR